MFTSVLLPPYYATFQNKETTKVMILPFDYIGYRRLSENKRFPNHRWYSDATWGEMGEGSPFKAIVKKKSYNMFISVFYQN